ncbi:MAG: CehA/McbA family metallohydrolase [Alphaproteobacteria bacterium]
MDAWAWKAITGVPLGFALANLAEWSAHQVLLHGLGRRKTSFWAFHWHEHHRASRRHGMLDPDYRRSPLGWHAQGKEVAALALASAAVLAAAPWNPVLCLTLAWCAFDYWRKHRRAHLDPAWAREHMPWHVDHHMGPEQDANWCVTRPWCDVLFGTRQPWVGTADEQPLVDRHPAVGSAAGSTHGASRAAAGLLATFLAGSLLSACGNTSSSAPVVADPIFYGDLHAHSGLSNDATGTPDQFFVAARDIAGLDFVVLSDHDIFLTPDEWEILKTTAASYDTPGSFVAFSAVEWTQAIGYHLNVYFRETPGPYCQGFDCKEASQFLDYYGSQVRAGAAAAQVNHAASRTFRVPWERIDDSVTNAVEVWNATSGAESNQELLDNGPLWALRAGFRLGLVGVSDDHHTDQSPAMIGTGITGCHAKALDRSDLLDAFLARRCFATDGERIRLDTRIGGTAMGGERDARIGDRLPARVEVVATRTPVTVELVSGGDVVATRTCETPVCDLDAEVVIADPESFVYARVVQEPGGRAWSSPVFVHATCGTDGTGCLDARLAGGEGGGDSCLLQWFLPADGARPTGDPAVLSCRDGDPSCDAAPEAGVCGIRVGFCFGADAPSGQACAATGIDRWNVEQPAATPMDLADQSDNRNRAVLSAMLHVGTLANANGAGPACTPLSILRLPPGRRDVRLSAGGGAVEDAEAATIECLPAAAGASILSAPEPTPAPHRHWAEDLPAGDC